MKPCVVGEDFVGITFFTQLSDFPLKLSRKTVEMLLLIFYMLFAIYV